MRFCIPSGPRPGRAGRYSCGRHCRKNEKDTGWRNLPYLQSRLACCGNRRAWKGLTPFCSPGDAAGIGGRADKASVFFVKCTLPQHTEDVMEDLPHLPPNFPVRPLKEYLSLITFTNI